MMEYRKAGPGDIDELVRMRKEFLEEVQLQEVLSHGKNIDEKEFQDNLKEYFIENISTGRFLAWIATENGEIVGTSGIYFYSLPPSFKKPLGKVAYIMNMYTKPAFRGRGIAPALFGRLLEEAKVRGCEKISLHATQMGKPVYEKFGFTVSNSEMVLNL